MIVNDTYIYITYVRYIYIYINIMKKKELTLDTP